MIKYKTDKVMEEGGLRKRENGDAIAEMNEVAK